MGEYGMRQVKAIMGEHLLRKLKRYGIEVVDGEIEENRTWKERFSYPFNFWKGKKTVTVYASHISGQGIQGLLGELFDEIDILKEDKILNDSVPTCCCCKKIRVPHWGTWCQNCEEAFGGNGGKVC